MYVIWTALTFAAIQVIRSYFGTVCFIAFLMRQPNDVKSVTDLCNYGFN